MEEYYFSANVGNDTTLHIAPLTSEKIEMSGQQFDDTSGYFLYEMRHAEEPKAVRVIARILSDDAAFMLSRMLNMN